MKCQAATNRDGLVRRSVLALMVLFLVAPDAFATSDEIIEVSLERTACHGWCPIYVVTLHADGSVVFTGRKFVKAVGTFRKRIPSVRLKPIFDAIEKMEFWLHEDIDEDAIAASGGVVVTTLDAPGQLITVKTQKRIKTLKNAPGVSAQLHELGRLIDEVAGVLEYVGRPDEQKL